MTNEQLDRLAAEKVMGWRVFDLSVDTGYSEAPCPKIIQNVIGEWIFFDVDGKTIKWSPTTNESHAAMVREKMIKDGWEIRTRAHATGRRVVLVRGALDEITCASKVVGLAELTVSAALLAVEAITEEELNA